MINLLLIVTVSRAQVDYEADIQPIFTNNCASCHINITTSGVNLGSYDDVMNSVGNQYGTDIVDPENPDNSPLVDKIEPNPDHGVRMPQGGPYLSDEQINSIRDWISEGANQTPTSVEPVADRPRAFTLSQNYPNPFNPSTVVSFTLPRTARYEINVYDLNGRSVWSTGGSSGAGTVEMNIMLAQQPSSVYVYRVQVFYNNGETEHKSGKMMLLK